MVTVLPIRLLAWSMANEPDMALDCWSEVNWAIWAAICVSDCGFSGSWFSICETSNCRKSFWFRVCCGPEIVSLEVVPVETLLVALTCIVLYQAQVSQPRAAAGCGFDATGRGGIGTPAKAPV